MTNTEIFYKFLVERGLMFRVMEILGYSLEKYCQHTTPENYVFSITNWDTLKEGMSYWGEIHRDWEQFWIVERNKRNEK